MAPAGVSPRSLISFFYAASFQLRLHHSADSEFDLVAVGGLQEALRQKWRRASEYNLTYCIKERSLKVGKKFVNGYRQYRIVFLGRSCETKPLLTGVLACRNVQFVEVVILVE